MPNGVCIHYTKAGVYVPDLRLHSREIIRGLETAVAAARKQSDRSAEGRHLGNLGNAYADLGDARKAIEFYRSRARLRSVCGCNSLSGRGRKVS